MNNIKNDPIGQAILDYNKTSIPTDIIVSSDICEDDIIPIEVLFRTFEEMPEIEKKAISLCKGSILEVGAGAGVHAIEMIKNGHEVYAIDISEGAVEHLKSKKINAKQINFFDLTGEKFDTISLLMNGIGIAGSLSKLPDFLNHAKSLLAKNGKILCDSSDIKYLYEDEEGALWVNLNTEYYGDFKFQMKYKDQTTEWFDWLYIDFDSLYKVGTELGFIVKRICVDDNHYLAELTLKD